MPSYDSYWFPEGQGMDAPIKWLEKCGYTVDGQFMIHPPKPVPPYWESTLEWAAILVLVHGWDCAYAGRGLSMDWMESIVEKHDQDEKYGDLFPKLRYKDKSINPDYYGHATIKVPGSVTGTDKEEDDE